MITKTYKFKTSTIAHCYTPDLKGAIKHYEITHPGYYIGGPVEIGAEIFMDRLVESGFNQGYQIAYKKHAKEYHVLINSYQLCN